MRWGPQAKTHRPVHLASAPRPVVLDSNRVTDKFRDFTCGDPTKPGVFNLDCSGGGAPPAPPPVPTAPFMPIRITAITNPAAPASIVAVGPPQIPVRIDAFPAPFIITIMEPEATILAMSGTTTPGTVAFGTDTKNIYVFNETGLDTWGSFEED